MKKCAAVENCLEITICHLLIKAKQAKVVLQVLGEFQDVGFWVFGEGSLIFFVDLSSDWILGVLRSLL